MTIAYLINQYPAASQTFIRREILALEQRGLTVLRYAIRRWPTPLVDERDKAEQQRTRYILDAGPVGLLWSAIKTAITRPGAFLRALRTAWQHGRRSGKTAGVHLVYLAEACVLREWLAATKVSHVHAHFGTNSTTVALLCHQLGGPTFSFTSHGPEEYDKPEAISLRDKVEQARFVVGISRFGCSQIYRWSRFEDWPKVREVHCGVDELFLKSPESTPPDEPRLVNIGRIGPSKGQLFLVQAAAKLAHEGMTFQLTLVGDGPLRGEIEDLIRREKLEHHIRIAGWMSNEQVRQEILNSRAMVLPSFAEGLPLVIMEALALHRPVLTTYIAGIPELVEPGVCGWLVPAGAIDELADAMREVLETPISRLAEMGRAGALRVAERHDARIEAGKLDELFRNGVSKA